MYKENDKVAYSLFIVRLVDIGKPSVGAAFELDRFKR
jgi:hypothetical protein